MNAESWGSLFFLAFIGTLILVPIYLRNRLVARQLDALTAAMQQGIAPERVRESLQLRRDDGDVNGNWKAGQILLAIGWTYLPFGLLALLASLSAKADAGAVVALLPGVVSLVVGARLLRIHRSVVGEVVRRDASPADAPPPAAVATGTASVVNELN